MSISVEINLPKGAEVKPVELIPEGLEFGEYGENYILREAAADSSSIIVYDPNKIGRGIMIDKDNDKLTLEMAAVTGPEEIKLYYSIIRNICERFGIAVFSLNDQLASPKEIENYIKHDIENAEAGLIIFTTKLEHGEEKYLTVFGAMNPIAVGLKDLRSIGADAEKFGDFIHEKQSVNAYYAGPQLYSNPEDGSLLGIYPFQADTYSIMPYEPIKPFYLEEEVGKWMVYLYVSDDMYGYIPFEVFSKHVKDLGRYDETHYFCEVNKYQARGLIADHAVEM